MKLRGIVREETQPSKNTMVVEFEGDKKKQHFEVKCSFNPHQHKFRKWDVIDMWIKWESEVFEDPKTGEKSYFTHLICDKAVEFVSKYGDK
ncbi:hypothetical protein LIV57_06575 [Chryseobacterium sp. X308]|uniref:hypothetical protein n=1 Tax=Chryseobacterium sp. X308 TaxID=2884873 RepID=UPI001D14F291|nr:hypothetical protein [Chryseobacterium sp. X308]MCC3214931.1 hypothetical protein [Chryseobacterium sp. X308]